MARVLVHAVIGLLLERQRHRPRPRPRARVVDRRLVADGVGVEARQPLGDFQPAGGGRVVAVQRQPHLGVEVGGLDHQRVALEAPARVAHPLRDLRIQPRPPVERDHPRLVDHLVLNDDVAGELEDLRAHVVAGGQHRGEQAARDAPVVGPEVGEGLERMLRHDVGEVVPVGAAHDVLALLALRGHRRQPAVGGIDDERRLALRQPALTPMRRRARAHAAARRAAGDHGFGIGFGLRAARVLTRGELFVGERVARAERGRPLERRALHLVARPDALQVRVAPGRSRHDVGAGRGAVRSRLRQHAGAARRETEGGQCHQQPDPDPVRHGSCSCDRRFLRIPHRNALFEAALRA